MPLNYKLRVIIPIKQAVTVKQEINMSIHKMVLVAIGCGWVFAGALQTFGEALQRFPRQRYRN